jgi:hypothetical protein
MAVATSYFAQFAPRRSHRDPVTWMTTPAVQHQLVDGVGTLRRTAEKLTAFDLHYHLRDAKRQKNKRCYKDT